MKLLLTLLYWVMTLFSLYVIVNSVGWLLGLFGLALLPFIVLHIFSGIKSYRRFPEMNNWLICSIIAFFLFSLARPDLDDVNGYTGLSVFLHHLGITSDRYVESGDVYFYIAFLFLLIMFVFDMRILLKKKNMVNTKAEFV